MHKFHSKIRHFYHSPFPRGMKTKFPGERGMKIRQIPRGIGDGDPRGGNPILYKIITLRMKNVIFSIFAPFMGF